MKTLKLFLFCAAMPLLVAPAARALSYTINLAGDLVGTQTTVDNVWGTFHLEFTKDEIAYPNVAKSGVLFLDDGNRIGSLVDFVTGNWNLAQLYFTAVVPGSTSMSLEPQYVVIGDLVAGVPANNSYQSYFANVVQQGYASGVFLDGVWDGTNFVGDGMWYFQKVAAGDVAHPPSRVPDSGSSLLLFAAGIGTAIGVMRRRISA